MAGGTDMGDGDTGLPHCCGSEYHDPGESLGKETGGEQSTRSIEGKTPCKTMGSFYH